PYADFLIENPKGGEPILYSSNHRALRNRFGANADAPFYLTPVFFRREVLSKYLANPERYTVEDDYLRASTQWAIQIDKKHKEYVIVFLGDLGRDLPYKEQLHWKSFNVEPARGVSEVHFRRSD